MMNTNVQLEEWLRRLSPQERRRESLVAFNNLNKLGFTKCQLNGKQELCPLSESPIMVCLLHLRRVEQLKQLAEQHFVTGSIPSLYIGNQSQVQTGIADSKTLT